VVIVVCGQGRQASRFGGILNVGRKRHPRPDERGGRRRIIVVAVGILGKEESVDLPKGHHLRTQQDEHAQAG